MRSKKPSHHAAAIVPLLICSAVSAPAAAQTFTDISTESGVQALRDSKPDDWWLSGLTFIDLNHDGNLDLFLSEHGDGALAALNDGTGHFTLASGTYPSTEIHNCLDIDEDGKVDLDATYADGGAKWYLNKTAVGSSMLELDDVGDFDTREGNQSRSEALVDINRDGKLDWVRTNQSANFAIDFGDGAGNFAANSAMVPQPSGNALDAGVMFADLDADGDEDMIVNWGGYDVPDDYGRARVLINDGQMNLVEMTSSIGVPTEHFAVLGVGDVDQDGDVDLIGLADKKFPEVLYLNDGHGSFSLAADAVTGDESLGSAQYSLWGLATLTDLDNDGIADILIDGRVFFHVLRGTGGGHFVYQNDAWGGISHVAEASVDGGYAFGDVDSDGDLDLMAFTSGEPNRQIALYRNDLPGQNWVNIRPVGLAGNKQGVNSKIRIYEAGTDHLLWFEEVSQFSKQAQQNYYAFDQLERHYGLGNRATVDVTIEFYPSGTVVRKNGVAANTTTIIGEDGTNGVVEPPMPKGDTSDGSSASSSGSSSGSSSAGSSGSSSGSSSQTSSGAAALSSSSSSDQGCGCHIGAGAVTDGKRGAIGAALTLLAFFGLRRRRNRHSAS